MQTENTVSWQFDTCPLLQSALIWLRLFSSFWWWSHLPFKVYTKFIEVVLSGLHACAHAPVFRSQFPQQTNCDGCVTGTMITKKDILWNSFWSGWPARNQLSSSKRLLCLNKSLTLWCVAVCQWKKGPRVACLALWAKWWIGRSALDEATQPCRGCTDPGLPKAMDSAPRALQRLNCSPTKTDLKDKQSEHNFRTESVLIGNAEFLLNESIFLKGL